MGYQALVANTENNSFGYPDLLVRGDYINKIFCNSIDIDESKNIYYIMDIKYTTIPLAANGIYINNSGLFPAYKAQMCVYNEALKTMQNKKTNCAFILGKMNNFTNGKVKHWNCYAFDRVGFIDFLNNDYSYIQKTYDAITW